ncbi:hypothetical protein DAPPUDRAFT_307167 [Daphnia pulex]|uniref:Uncharacterized protein n=1 Tax=Daphnia pulex TaxID=6669 RepID=E9G027_DAPPU|nr:hypothetical protein DAPPUDRAFT_307167 [Daphnia pulex]|eukprot:EFX87159.1 hypothetical protein DAPPUDRAFT_307167 [Daphnia pulex]
MPQVKSVESLFQLCLNNVTDHMDEWAKKSPKLNGVEDIEFIKKSTNPFYDLPSVIIEEIILLLKKKKLLETKFIELLITPQLWTLDFRSMCEENEVSGLLHLATIISPDLKNLWLFHEEYFLDNDKYESFIPKFSNLQVVDISYSKKGDSCLQLLGLYCKDLRVLHAKHSSVSDYGIQQLCVSGQCKSIHTLDVFSNFTCVTTKGLQLAIQNLPALTILRHPLLVDALADMAQAAMDEKLETPKLSLSTLAIHSSYKAGSLALAVSICPSITTIDVRIAEGLTDIELHALLPLKNISSIHFCASDHNTFDGGIVPLLKSFGKSLKSLELFFFTSTVKIPAVIEYCPNLKSLTLCCNTSYSMAWPEESQKSREGESIDGGRLELKKLEQLQFFLGKGCIDSEVVLALLSSSSLKSIFLRGCCILTDDVLLKAANYHSFRNLESLDIFDCKSVSSKGIDVLMEEGNSLKSLDIRDCGQILIKHISSWVRKAAKNNWELSVYPKVPLCCVEHSDSDDSDSEEGFELLHYFLAGFIHDMLDSDDDEDIEVEEDSDEDQNWNESAEESEGVEDDDDVMEF